MVQRKGSIRRRTRHKLKKNIRQKGKINIAKYLQEFKTGDKVILNADSGFQKGVYPFRYHGLPGIIKSKTGSCYNVVVKAGKLEKQFIVHPVHLKQS